MDGCQSDEGLDRDQRNGVDYALMRGESAYLAAVYKDWSVGRFRAIGGLRATGRLGSWETSIAKEGGHEGRTRPALIANTLVVGTAALKAPNRVVELGATAWGELVPGLDGPYQPFRRDRGGDVNRGHALEQGEQIRFSLVCHATITS